MVLVLRSFWYAKQIAVGVHEPGIHAAGRKLDNLVGESLYCQSAAAQYTEPEMLVTRQADLQNPGQSSHSLEGSVNATANSDVFSRDRRHQSIICEKVERFLIIRKQTRTRGHAQPQERSNPSVASNPQEASWPGTDSMSAPPARENRLTHHPCRAPASSILNTPS